MCYKVRMSKFDQIYRSILLSKFFTKGWGNPEYIKRLIEFRPIVLDREKCQSYVPRNYPVHIDKEERSSDCLILEGHFRSPFADCVPEVVPEESQTAYFQVLLPKQWKTRLKPVCLHLAGTGDHYFWRRRTLLAKPLLKEAGIGSIILENPFYGLRKPRDQIRSSLHNVSDIFVMGGCLAFESTVLFHWCERQGFGPLGVTGISMGGHMASIAASIWPRPIALIPCLSWTTASCVFTQGVMSGAIPWNLLENQYFSDCVYREELKNMLFNLHDDVAFEVGQHFVKNYTESMQRVAAIRDSHRKESTQEKNAQQIDMSEENYLLMQNAGSSSSLDVNRMLSGASTRRNVTAQESVEPDDDDDQPTLSAVFKFSTKKKPPYTAALQFMRGIMDEFTHLARFSPPVDPSLIIIVVAKEDAYVLRDGIVDLTEVWPGAEVRYIDAGHIAAFLFKQSVFRKAIIDAFDRLTDKYYKGQV